MMRIALGISYDGTAYHGWQKQTQTELTIQRKLEIALSQFADHPIRIICAGRTDAGVHALEQVIHFDTTADRRDEAWIEGTNSFLPQDIRVEWMKAVNEDFHARFSPIARSYRYIIYNHAVNSAIHYHRTTWFRWALDVERMHESAQYLVGEHDFTSYRDIDCQAKSPIRTIHYIHVQRENDFIFVDIKANAFLHHMVRNIVGVLLLVGSEKKPVTFSQEVLETKDRTKAGITAPPTGLYLVRVDYPENFVLPQKVFYEKHPY